ncbi:acylphosphatase [Salipaludibacillus sp. HK11]|uniref:acylphosphatase n=1 Tax=Salipaludibacillus sp. HK11 TaxID=3394320 RepID=UPI0039FC7B51
MKERKVTYLPQLENSIPLEAHGYSVSMYSLALEGWRRGLKLKFVNRNRRRSEVEYSLSNDGNEHFFSVVKGDAIPRSATKICLNKQLTKDNLIKAGVPTPDGETFGNDVKDESITRYASELGYPVVLKPSNGTAGAGVIANIKNEDEFKEALSYVKYDLKFSELIVEKFATGEDHRMYVIDDQVVASFKKIPANVIGNGKDTINQLLEDKNLERTKTPALSNRPITVDKESDTLLRSKGYTLDSVPPMGEIVYLKTKNNVSSGGDPIDVTDDISDELKQIAIDAAKSIPGLVQCGVDMIIDQDKGTGVVLEVNSRPHITAHLFPMEGKARDIPKHVVDYYFPETKQAEFNTNVAFYFDFKTIFDALNRGVCEEFTVPKIPEGELTSTRFRIKGERLNEAYQKWVRGQALKLNLHGYVKKLTNGETSIVVSGPNDSITKFRDIVKKQSPNKSKVKAVDEKNWDKPVRIGFEIGSAGQSVKKDSPRPQKSHSKTGEVEGYQPVKLEEVFKKNPNVKKHSLRKTHSVEKERDLYKKKYNEIEKSTLWRVTRPIRSLSDLAKSFKKTK